MNYFSNCADIDSAKTTYRNLAKQFHPDKGGDTSTMQQINKEFDFYCVNFYKKSPLKERENQWLNLQEFKDKLAAVSVLPGIIVEIVGGWIWITGNTFGVHTQLKQAGFTFASKKLAWHWSPKDLKGGKGTHSLDTLKSHYGCQKVSGNYALSM